MSPQILMSSYCRDGQGNELDMTLRSCEVCHDILRLGQSNALVPKGTPRDRKDMNRLQSAQNFWVELIDLRVQYMVFPLPPSISSKKSGYRDVGRWECQMRS